MRAIDTNVLVRIITRDDEKQTPLADSFVSKGVWASHVVLVETIWVLRDTYGLGREHIATVLDMLLNHESITLQDSDVVQNALQRYQQKPALGFLDCLILEIARKAGHLPLGTFDKALAKLDGVERI